MSDRVGPILFGHPIARGQFVTEGVVITFRAGDKRTTGDTWARWKRTGKAMADARVEALTPADPSLDVTPFSEYVDRSGFGTVERWLDAIQESGGHGDAGDLPSGHLYRVTFQAPREPLKEWLRGEYGLTHCDGCGESVAPYVYAHGSGYSGDVRTRRGVQGVDIGWCTWCLHGPEPEERPEGWRFNFPGDMEIEPDAGECPKCGTGVKFLDGEGPYCPACDWRSDDKPRPRTDGGTPSGPEVEAAAATRRADRTASKIPNTVLGGQPLGECGDCGARFEYGRGTALPLMGACPECGARDWDVWGYRYNGEEIPRDEAWNRSGSESDQDE